MAAISRAIYFNARILIMDEPTATLTPTETERLFGLMRRRHGVGSARLEWAGVAYDAGLRSFACADQPLQLSPREHATLLALIEAQGSPLARQALFDRVFVDDADVAPDALEVVLYRLRKRLGELGVTIRNVRGIGFYLDPERP